MLKKTCGLPIQYFPGSLTAGHQGDRNWPCESRTARTFVQEVGWRKWLLQEWCSRLDAYACCAGTIDFMLSPNRDLMVAATAKAVSCLTPKMERSRSPVGSIDYEGSRRYEHSIESH